MSIILRATSAKLRRLKAIHLPNLFFRLFYGSKSFTFDVSAVSSPHSSSGIEVVELGGEGWGLEGV